MKTHCGWKSWNVSLMSVALSVALAGCASMNPPVPPDVAQSSSPSQLRSTTFLSFVNGSFEAGEYSVTGINYGVVRADNVRLGPLTRGTSSGKFTFSVAGPRAGWSAECSRGTRSRGIAVDRAELEFEKSRLHCELVSGPRRAMLELHGLDSSRNGSVRIDGASYSVRQYFADMTEPGKPYTPGPLGLRIDRDGKNVGALEFARPGAFWINRTLAPEQQDALAGILAALLIDQRRNGA